MQCLNLLLMARRVNFAAAHKGRQTAGRSFPGRQPAVVAGLLLAYLLFCLGGARPAWAVALNSSWEYQLSGGDEQERSERFLERYNLSTGFTLTPTDAVTTGATLAYSRSTVTGLGTSETLTPTANLQLTNDIFVVGLSGTLAQTRSPTAGTLDIYSWGTSLGSNWKQPFWPTLRFYYDESGQSSAAQAIDQSESSSGADLSWILPAAKFFYGFSQRLAEDHINLNQVETTSHMARLETGGTFFAKRLAVKLSESFNTSSSAFSLGAGGEVAVAPPLPPSYFGVVISDPATIDLLPGVDFPPFTQSLTIPRQEAGHLGVQGLFDFNGAQQLNQLRVHVDEATAIRVDTGQVDLQWALYISQDNLRWEVLPGQGIIAPLYNSVERRFEIALPALAAFPAYDFLKAVAINSGNTDVVFTALEALQLVTASQRTEQTTYQTDLTLSYRITSTLRASSTMNLLLAEGISRRNLHGNLGWSPSPYVGFSLGVSDNLQQSDASPDRTDRVYSLTMPINPLPSLNFSSGVSRAERFVDARKISSIDTFSLNSTAVIYPDLKAGMSFGYATGETEIVVGEKLARENFFGTFSLIAKLSRRLNANIAHSYSQTLLPAENTIQSSSLNVTYRPSDLLVTRLLATKTWSGEDPIRVDFRLDLALLRTHNTRLNFNYRHLLAETNSDAFGLSGGWDFSDNFTLQTQTGYRVEELNSWNINVKLLMRI